MTLTFLNKSCLRNKKVIRTLRGCMGISETGDYMSIFIDPEEYYGSPEPEKLSKQTEEYLRFTVSSVPWFDKQIEQIIAPEDIESESTQKEWSYKMNFDRDEMEGGLW